MTARARSAAPRRPQPGGSGAATTSSWFDRGAAWLLVACLAAPFLVHWSPAADPFRLPKLLAAESLGLASLLLLAMARLAGGANGAPKPAGGSRRRLATAAALLALAGSASLGLVTSAHGLHVRHTLPSVLVGLGFLGGWALAGRPGPLRRALEAVLLPAAVIAGVAALQALDLWQPFRFAEKVWESRLHITSLAGNSGDLSMALVLPLLVAQERLRRQLAEPRPGGRAGSRRGPRLVATALLLALLVGGLLLSQGLSGLVAAIGGSATLWLLGPHRRRAGRFMAVAAAGAALVATLHPGIRGRILDKTSELATGQINEFLTYRLDGWRAAAWMLAEHPVWGVGVGAFPAEYADAKLALLDRGAVFGESSHALHFDNAHNEYLHWAAETGWLGALALALGLAVLAGALRRLPPDALPLAGAGVAAASLLALVQFPFQIAIAAYPLLALLAWILAVARTRDGDGDRNGTTRSGAPGGAPGARR